MLDSEPNIGSCFDDIFPLSVEKNQPVTACLDQRYDMTAQSEHGRCPTQLSNQCFLVFPKTAKESSQNTGVPFLAGAVEKVSFGGVLVSAPTLSVVFLVGLVGR